MVTPRHSPDLLAGAGRVCSRFDPGWLLVLAGAAVLSLASLLPVTLDSDRAAAAAQRAKAARSVATQRLANYAAYMRALDNADEDLVRSLAISQLNLVPSGHRAAAPLVDLTVPHAVELPAVVDVFASLEPSPPAGVVPDPQPRSVLERLATGQTTRFWLFACGATAVLFGLFTSLPTSPRAGCRLRSRADLIASN